MAQAFIFDAVRTPRGKGKKDGSLHEVKPVDLLAGLLVKLQQRHDFDPAALDDVVMGVVSPVGEQGSVIAKTAALKAGWDVKVAGMQINRFCASGLEAVNLAAQKVASGWEDLVVAGGVESMSRVPIGSDGGAWSQDPATNVAHRLRAAGHRRRPDRHARRLGPRGRRPLCARPRSSAPRRRRPPATSTARCCRSTTRSACRCSSATSSSSRARRSKAWARSRSRSPSSARWASTRSRSRAIPQVERIEHVHTAGNSSGIVDGAAAVLIGSEAKGRALGLTPRGAHRRHRALGADPTIMLTGPMPASAQGARQGRA